MWETDLWAEHGGDKILVAGVIDVKGRDAETPEIVAGRIRQTLRSVAPERAVAVRRLRVQPDRARARGREDALPGGGCGRPFEPSFGPERLAHARTTFASIGHRKAAARRRRSDARQSLSRPVYNPRSETAASPARRRSASWPSSRTLTSRAPGHAMCPRSIHRLHEDEGEQQARIPLRRRPRRGSALSSTSSSTSSARRSRSASTTPRSTATSPRTPSTRTPRTSRPSSRAASRRSRRSSRTRSSSRRTTRAPTSRSARPSTIEGDNGKEKYTIVGSVEAAPEAGRISNESPVGRALLGRKKGERSHGLGPRRETPRTRSSASADGPLAAPAVWGCGRRAGRCSGLTSLAAGPRRAAGRQRLEDAVRAPSTSGA